ncbi:MAG: hypothetical protein HYW25_04585 [Candidatus Aenigmarchaeota archaeon]|nr:hypothetical protein [Candidatus Aenigmarchaeota archaeon]
MKGILGFAGTFAFSVSIALGNNCIPAYESRPAPYCGVEGSLAWRPSTGVDPELLLFINQTENEEDIVWLRTDGAEYDRCCPPDIRVVDAVYNDGEINCNSDTFFLLARSGYNTGKDHIYEIRLPAADPPITSSLYCNPCGGTGEEEVACDLGKNCPVLRKFTFGFTNDAVGITIARPSFADRPLLVVSRGLGLYFLDPTQSSCDAEEIEPLGKCGRLEYDGKILVPSSLIWLGDDNLLGITQDREAIEIALGEGYSCTITSYCADIIPSGWTNMATLNGDGNILFGSTDFNYYNMSRAQAIYNLPSPFPQPSDVGNALRVTRREGDVVLDWSRTTCCGPDQRFIVGRWSALARDENDIQSLRQSFRQNPTGTEIIWGPEAGLQANDAGAAEDGSYLRCYRIFPCP